MLYFREFQAFPLFVFLPTNYSYSKGLTINNLNKFVVRYFEDSGTSTGSVQALSGLKPNSDKTVTNPSLKAGVNPPAPYTPYNPSLKAGVSGYTPYRGFSPDGTTTRSCSCYLLSIPYREKRFLCFKGSIFFPRSSILLTPMGVNSILYKTINVFLGN